MKYKILEPNDILQKGDEWEVFKNAVGHRWVKIPKRGFGIKVGDQIVTRRTIHSRGLIIRKEHLDNILNGQEFMVPHGNSQVKDLGKTHKSHQVIRKTWEMRSRPTQVRGRIYLIEAGSGLVVGETTIIDSLPKLTQKEALKFCKKHQVSDLNLLDKWCYPWVFENSIRYEKPIPYNHPKGAVIWVNLESIFS